MVYDISVVVPCYYLHIPYLNVTFQDICAQTILPKEVILSISQINEETKEKIYDQFINLFKSVGVVFQIIYTIEEQYAGINRNIGAKAASCEYIIFIDADDSIHPQKIEITKYFLEKYQPDIMLHSFVLRQPLDYLKFLNINYIEASIYTTQKLLIDTFGDPAKRDRNIELVRRNCHSLGQKSPDGKYRMIPHGYPTVRKSLFDKYQYTNLKSGEDGVFIRDVLWDLGNIIFVDVPLMNYRPNRTI